MTKYVADKLISEFKRHRISVDCFRIESVQIRNIVLSEYDMYDMFGIVYPVHSFNAPEIVINFVKRLPESNGMYAFIINTAGEDNIINYASSDLLIKKLNKNGYKVFYNKLIEMPSNFIVKYDAAKVRMILDRADEIIPRAAKDIAEFTPYFMRKIFIAKIMAVIGRAEWYGARILGKFFYAKNGCARCGKCADNCPNHNIVMNKKSVSFKWRCNICMRCVYLCPKNLISVHQPFKFIRFDKWYDTGIFKQE